MVELRPSKPLVRVRFPSPAPLGARVFVFDFLFFAHVAQSVEHFLGKEEVAGSIPVVSTMSRFMRRFGF
jgi:hypothetical protein